MGLVLTNSAALVLLLLHVPFNNLYYLVPIRKNAKFLEFWKRAEVRPSRGGSRSKTFPEVPKVFPCITQQSRIAASHISRTRNTQGLTGNAGYSRVARSFRIKKKILHQRVPNLSHQLVHCRGILSFAQRAHQVSFVWLCQLLHSKFFVILQVLGNLLRDLPEKLCFTYLILHMTNSFPFELDQTLDLPGRVPFSGIQAVGQFLKRSKISAFRLSNSLLSISECASDNRAANSP